MKKTLILLNLIFVFACQTKEKIESKSAEISCGQCNFEMEGDGCELAVRFNDLNKTFFVEGFGIDDFGDAHDEQTGFCNIIRKANVEGNIVNNKFVASKIELID